MPLEKNLIILKVLSTSEYVSLASRLRKEEKLIKGQLRGREMRIAINKATAARKRSREQGRLSSVIKSICETH